MKDLFYYLVSNASTIINYSTLLRKINIDAKTIKKYIGYFEDNFLIHTISLYHTKLTHQIQSAKKLYMSDNGFLNLGINKSLNNGKRLENVVFTILNKKCECLTYLKEIYEIDFFCDKTYYQVSYEIDDEKTRKRELHSFKHFNKNNNKNVLITYDTNEQLEDTKIISLDKFIFESTR